MRELINDPFYELIGNYDRCIIDYCLIEDHTPHQGYRSHKDAVLFAMLKVIERYIDTQLESEVRYGRKVRDEPFPWNLDIVKPRARRIDEAELFHVPVMENRYSLTLKLSSVRCSSDVIPETNSVT